MSETPDDVFMVDTSFAQQSMWLLHQMDPRKPTYNVTAGARIAGPLQAAALHEALNQVIARHESLRTVFQLQGNTPMQVILPVLTVPLPVTDVHPSQLDAAVRREAETPFDLERGPLLRMRLLRLAPDDHILVLIMHHIIFDGVSSAIMFRELSSLYQAGVGGPAAALPELPVQYADYAVWQRETLAGDRLDRMLGFWTDRLAGADPLLLPADRPRPADRSSRGETLEFGFPAELMQAVEELARERRATLFMVLLAALGGLLSKYSGQTDITISTAIANRGRPEIAGIIGYFVNTLVLRTDLSGNPSVTELIGRAASTCRAAYDHQDIPFDTVVEAVRPTRDGGVGNALVRAMLVLQNMETEPWESGGLVFEPMRLDTRTVLLDISMTFEPAPTGHGYSCLVEYSTDLFDRATIGRFVDSYQQMLQAFVTSPDTPLEEITLPGDQDWAAVLSGWNATSVDMPDRPVHDLVTEQVARAPVAIAVEQGATRLTYAELGRRAGAMAAALRSAELPARRPEPVAAVVMDSCPDLVAVLLGVLASGWAFVPLDPRLPPGRIAEILDDCGARVVFTQRARVATLTDACAGRAVICPDDGLPAGELPAGSGPVAGAAPGPGALACVFYTSGSTSVPKGVMFTHGALTNFALGVAADFGLTAQDRFFQLSSIGFDVLLEEIFPALVTGATVVIPAEPILAVGGDLGAQVTGQRISVLDLTPAYWHEWTRELAARGGPPGTLRLVVVGGDRVLPESVDTWRRFGPELIEGYGLTEGTVITTSCHLSRTAPGSGPSAVIGTPTPNTRLHVLDRRLRPVPPGGVGEIYISGAGVARGYLHRAAETATRFIPDPAGPPGSAMFRTGDLARRRGDGEVEFIGRVDHQIKLRGHRVEPAEIEAVIAAHPDVTEAVVLAWDDHGGKRLVAYVTPAPGQALDSSVVRGFAAERLPEVLVPAAVAVLEVMPLTRTGKIDRNALAELDLAWLPASRQAAGPDEQLMCQLLAEALGVREVGAEDDFFAMGGDSITAIQLAARARGAGLAISPRDVFTRRTAARMAAAAAEPDRDGVVTTGPMPVTPAAGRLAARGGPLAGYAEAMVVRVPVGLTQDHLVQAAQLLLDHHDALRMRLTANPGSGPRLEIVAPGTTQARELVSRVDIAGADRRRLTEVITEQARAARRRLDPEAAVMGQLTWLDAGDQAGLLLVVMHDLVADEESWPMLLADLITGCGAAADGRPVKLEPPVTSLREWGRSLEAAATEPSRVGEFRFWRENGNAPDPLLGARRLDRRDVASSAESVTSVVDPDLAGPLLSDVPVVYHVGAEDVLLTGLALAAARWRETRGQAARGGQGGTVRIMLDGTGRDEQLVAGADLSRTVGRFTSPLPLALNPGEVPWPDVLAARPAVGLALKRVKEQLRAVPGAGLGYGLLRYLNAETGPVLAGQPDPQLRFRYLSRLGAGDPAWAGGWSLDRDLSTRASHADPELRHVLQLEVVAEDGPEGPVLTATWSWAGGVLSQADVEELAGYWRSALDALARQAAAPDAGRLSPSDLPLVSVTQDEIDSMESELRSAPGTLA